MTRLLSMQCALALLLCAALGLPAAAWSASEVQAIRQGDNVTLSNESISATWTVQGGALRFQSVTNSFTGTTLASQSDTFEFIPKEGAVLHSSELKIVLPPVIEEIPIAANSSKAADHVPGKQVRIELEDASGKDSVTVEGDAARRCELRSSGGDDSCGEGTERAGADCAHRLAGAGRICFGPCEGIARRRRNVVPGLRTSSIRMPRTRVSGIVLAFTRTAAAGGRERDVFVGVLERPIRGSFAATSSDTWNRSARILIELFCITTRGTTWDISIATTSRACCNRSTDSAST